MKLIKSSPINKKANCAKNEPFMFPRQEQLLPCSCLALVLSLTLTRPIFGRTAPIKVLRTLYSHEKTSKKHFPEPPHFRIRKRERVNDAVCSMTGLVAADFSPSRSQWLLADVFLSALAVTERAHTLRRGPSSSCSL